MICRKLFYIIPLIISTGYSQNLVPNSGFEDFQQPCDITDGGINGSSLQKWFAPTEGSSDWFHKCATRATNTGPKNQFGNMHPQSGHGYAGFYVFTTLADNYKEYISVELTDTLQKGISYKLSFYTSLSSLSQYSADNLDILFSENKIVGGSTEALDNKPSKSNTSQQLRMKGKWIFLEFTYLAKGDERYLTIGSFEQKMKILQFPNMDEGISGAYYYIDNISLTEIKRTPVE